MDESERLNGNPQMQQLMLKFAELNKQFQEYQQNVTVTKR